MADIVRSRVAPCQPTNVDQHDMAMDHGNGVRSTSVDHDESLSVLRQVIADLGYSLDALQAAMRKDRSFINKVLNGDKPMPSDFLDALPDDIEAEWHSRRASRFGRVVVAPLSGPDAINALVSGLVGVLAPSALPAKAAAMARATLPHLRKGVR